MVAAPERPRRGRVLALAFTILAASAILIAAGSSPGVCARCHATQARELAASRHRDLACYDCHLSAGDWSWPQHKARELFVMYPGRILGRRAGVSDPISRAACLACHAASLSGVRGRTDLRIRHAFCAGPVGRCDSCHALAAHGKARAQRGPYDMGSCLSCHAESGASVACDTCHVSRPVLRRPTRGVLGAVHGREWRAAHTLADERTCGGCHEATFCAPCHTSRLPHRTAFLTLHGRESLRPGAACVSCHADPVFCEGCHGLPMPHPEGFRASHPASAAGREDSLCTRCHPSSDCADCHRAHAHAKTTSGTLRSSPLPAAPKVGR